MVNGRYGAGIATSLQSRGWLKTTLRPAKFKQEMGEGWIVSEQRELEFQGIEWGRVGDYTTTPNYSPLVNSPYPLYPMTCEIPMFSPPD